MKVPERDKVLTADGIRSQVLRQTLWLGLPLAGLIAVYYALWSPLPPHHGSRAGGVLGNLVALVLFTVLIAVLYRRIWGPLLRRNLAWIGIRQPSEVERSWLIAVPRRLAVQQFVAMVVVAGLITGSNRLTGGVGSWAIFVGLTLVGLTFAALVYLVAERVLRPVFALVELGSHSTGAVGVGVRMLIAWAVGSGIPLLFLAAIPLRGSAGVDRLPVTVPLEFMTVYALVVGALVTLVVARSIADPLAKLRIGLRQVRAGDLSASVSVEDPGEIGSVQAAFNSMVDGLRERERLSDLFGRHVGVDVARQALTQGVALGGERREATALFVDVVGSTAMAQTNSAEQVVQVLNQFFAAVVRSVAAEGGWVNKFEGDGALCVFGAPASDPDHALHGLRAARTLRRDLLALAAAQPGFDAAIGVSSGDVVAGNIGSEERYEYTVIGTPVNEAARLTDAAKDRLGRVLASDEAVSRAGGEHLNWAVAGEMALRGLAEPTLTYEPRPAAAQVPTGGRYTLPVE